MSDAWNIPMLNRLKKREEQRPHPPRYIPDEETRERMIYIMENYPYPDEVLNERGPHEHKL
jgi:hypothetical protein